MNWIDELKEVQAHKGNKYSQYGEENYLRYIFYKIGVGNRFLVDIGANDGEYISNTAYFRKDMMWRSVLIDGKKFPGVHQHFVTAENINDILKSYNVPETFDLLSLDIDGNDYWVLREVLKEFRPRVIISEYNSEFTDSRAIEYDPAFEFKATDHYGYTFEAGLKLAEEFGYKVIFQNSNLNMYYLRKDEIEDPEIEIYVPHPQHDWWRLNNNGQSDLNGKWVQI